MGKLYLSEESTAPSAPSTGKIVVYPKTDGLLYWKDDAGTEYSIGSTWPDGTANAPGARFNLDTDTGIWRPGNDTIGFAAGGAEIARLSASGLILGNGDTAAVPVAGAIRLTNASGTDVAGVSLTITSGRATGSGTNGRIVFRLGQLGSTGTSLATDLQVMTIHPPTNTTTSPGSVHFGGGDYPSSTATASLLQAGVVNIWSRGANNASMTFVNGRDDNAAAGNNFVFVRHRGTGGDHAAPQTVATSDRIGRLLWQGYTGTQTRTSAQIDVWITDTVSSAGAPGTLQLGTANSGTETNVARISIRHGTSSLGTIVFGDSITAPTATYSTVLKGADHSGTNIVGGSLTIAAALGTGNANSGDLIFQTGNNGGGSGTTLATAEERMRIVSTSSGTGAVFIGNGATSGTPSAALISGTGGTGSNIAGGAVTIRGGRSTGSAAGGAITLQTSPAGGAGSSTNNAVNGLILTSANEILIGPGISTSNSIPVGSSTAAQIQVHNLGSLLSASYSRYSNDSSPGIFVLGKSRGATIGSFTAVQSGDELGVIRWAGADGTDLQARAAEIVVAVDGTPGTGDMPGRMVFSTTSDGAETCTERMRINNAGDVYIAGDPTPAALSTSATARFPFIPSCAGAPSGVPANTRTGFVPMVYDTSNNRIYFYNGSWRSVAVT